jgi:hypothetical protein
LLRIQHFPAIKGIISTILLLELREGEKEREKERERERNLWKVDTRKELQKEKEILELEVIP